MFFTVTVGTVRNGRKKAERHENKGNKAKNSNCFSIDRGKKSIVTD